MSVSSANAQNQNYELQLSPALGWSNYSGLHLGIDSAIAIPLSERWQWKVGAGFVGRTKSNYKTFALTTGAIYNFNDKLPHAFFVGAGVGYGNRYDFKVRDSDDNRSLYGYAEFGKRFSLNKSETLHWIPTFTLASDFEQAGFVSINPLQFSWTF